MLNAIFSFLLTALLEMPGLGGLSQPVRNSFKMENVAPDTIRLVFDLSISNGWHVYSTELEKGGPTEALLSFDEIEGAQPVGKLSFTGNEIEVDDPLFRMKVRYFENKVTFTQLIALTCESGHFEGHLEYGACNDQTCLSAQNIEFRHKFGGLPDGTNSNTASMESDASSGSMNGGLAGDSNGGLAGDSNGGLAGGLAGGGVSGLEQVQGYNAQQWAPVSYDRDTAKGANRGLLGLFLTSFLGGLLALLTPCVWPIIPMTVSFFLKRAESRSHGIRSAALYGLCVILVYVTLGLLVTLIFGANALNSLSTNAIVNLIFFAILVIFALSFFGLFEITLPSSWSTKFDSKSRNGGFAGIFFMALTLTIVSFSCTGPIIGFLLVDAASTGSIVAPVIGMTGFSLALAIPFTLFAMFPQVLKSMPKSGGWMDRVKVTLGFIELAFSLKFLSVADMAYGWGILPRDLFVLLWIIMALVLGLYLLGVVRMHKGETKSKPKMAGIVVGIASLAFAAWLIPGLWGAPLKAISAFTPPMSTQVFNRDETHVEAQYTDYAQALEAARISGKPLLIDFTGFGCVNCRKMEASVWTDPRVAEKISNDYILVSLFVDDKTPLETPVTITENGTRVKIRTVGDKWSLLQRYKFGANAQPFYVITDSNGNLTSGPYSFNPSPDAFLHFLQ